MITTTTAHKILSHAKYYLARAWKYPDKMHQYSCNNPALLNIFWNLRLWSRFWFWLNSFALRFWEIQVKVCGWTNYEQGLAYPSSLTKPKDYSWLAKMDFTRKMFWSNFQCTNTRNDSFGAIFSHWQKELGYNVTYV